MRYLPIARVSIFGEHLSVQFLSNSFKHIYIHIQYKCARFIHTCKKLYMLVSSVLFFRPHSHTIHYPFIIHSAKRIKLVAMTLNSQSYMYM